jgi:hypothetical protein
MAQELGWSLCPPLVSSSEELEILYRCPRDECSRNFIARYVQGEAFFATGEHARIAPVLNKLLLAQLVPSTPIPPQIPDEVAVVSPPFVQVYSQALDADTHGLTQVVGPGLRKALEFLIKDYCISLTPADKEKISSAWLGTVIRDHVEDPRIKLCAERSAWLGNDETHYVRMWEEKDLKSLKELIVLTINWIHSDLLTKQYKDEMPSRGSR